MREKYITAAECLKEFEKIGLSITKGAFSKQKEKGTYRVYKKPNTKREYFIWDEVLDRYLNETSPKDWEEEQLRAKIRKQHKIQKKINKERDIIERYTPLTFEMFDTGNIGDAEPDKTREENLADFRLAIYAANETRLNNRDLAISLCEDLEKVYSDFRGSGLEYYILKSFADWMELMDPQGFADSWGIGLADTKEGN